MTQVIKEKPAPKRGGLLYWSILYLFRGLIPTIALIIIPLFVAIASGNIAIYLIPVIGIITTFFWVRRKHKKLMVMDEESYQLKCKIQIIKNPKRDLSPSTNPSDAMMTGEYFCKGAPGSIFNPDYH